MSIQPSRTGSRTPPSFEVPAGACDCHTHIFGPAERYKFSPGRTYTPGDASIESLLALQADLHFDRVVIVQPSPYGADNTCTVDAVRVLGGRARGVAVIDTTTSDEALRDMHDAGIRGVRVNLETSGQTNPAEALEQLRWAATRVAPFGWHVQIFTNLGLLAPLHDAILALPTPLVIDHFGRPKASQGVGQPGFDRLLSLMGSGRVYLKLSAPHRISQQPDYSDVPPIAQALITENPDRLIWGTDWPHPGARPGVPRSIDGIEPFRNEDDGAALNRLAGWVGNPGALRRILADNPARLYDFSH